MKRDAINNPRRIVETEMQRKYRSGKAMKCIGVFALLLSIGYLMAKFDFDDTLMGRVDDFLFFMSAFCFMYAQFMSIKNVRAIVLLKFLSLIFLFFGTVSLVVLFLV